MFYPCVFSFEVFTRCIGVVGATARKGTKSSTRSPIFDVKQAGIDFLRCEALHRGWLEFADAPLQYKNQNGGK